MASVEGPAPDSNCSWSCLKSLESWKPQGYAPETIQFFVDEATFLAAQVPVFDHWIPSVDYLSTICAETKCDLV